MSQEGEVRRRSTRMGPLSPSHTTMPPSSMNMISTTTRRMRWCVSMKLAGSSHAIDPYAHGHGRFWPVLGIAGHSGNSFGDFLAFYNFPENGVLVVQPGRRR